jgi:hypothetical protein
MGVSNVTLGGGGTGGDTGDWGGIGNYKLVFVPGANVTLSQTTNASSASIAVYGAAPGGTTFYSISEFNPRELISASLTSSHDTNYYFVPMVVPECVVMSKALVVKSFNVGAGGFTSQNSVQSHTWTLYHGITIFSRSNYAANSSQLASVASGSLGLSFQGSYNNSSHSLDVRFVTNSTGGTTSWSTASQGINYSSYWTGNKFLQIPIVTTLNPGHYWVAHRHSTAWATAGANASAKTWYSISNLAMTNQASTVGGIGSNGSYVYKGLGDVGDGLGVCSGTTGTMSISAISLSVPHYFWQAFQALPVTTVLA